MQIDTVNEGIDHVTIEGLNASTPYYFRVRASNVKGDSRPSKATSGIATDAIVRLDNASADGITGSGTWFRSTAVEGFHQTNYFEDGNTGKGPKMFRFSPALDTAGTYQVFLKWTSANDRAASVPVDVTSVAGTNTVRVNQRKQGGQWVLIGRYNFDPAASAPMVTIRTAGTRGYVVADAVKFAQTIADAKLSKPRPGTRKSPAVLVNPLQIDSAANPAASILLDSTDPRVSKKVSTAPFQTTRLVEAMELASAS
jgi:hypothetical protein